MRHGHGILTREQLTTVFKTPWRVEEYTAKSEVCETMLYRAASETVDLRRIKLLV